MSVSKLLPSSGANDFNIALGGTYTAVTLSKEYPAGGYSIVSASGDVTLDIYAYNADGTLAVYTSTKSMTATKSFNKIVILGGQSGDLLSFTSKLTFISTDETSEVTAGAVATSVTPSSAPGINDTFTLTGRNFASNVAVTFTSANTTYTATAAKGIVRSNATSLIVTRPDNMPTTYSPYTLTVSNPGVDAPIGSNSHILSNAISAGNAPVWVTGSTVNLTLNASNTITLSATDADPSSTVSYSIASGTLPSGLSLNGSTGAITGTPTTSQQTVTFRATDNGGNYVDKAIKFNANPVWTTAAGALTIAVVGTSYSQTVVATDDNGAISYSVTSGSLPTGLSLNSSTGVISGTNGATASTTSSFTITATDTEGGSTARAFTIYNGSYITTTLTAASGTWTPSSTQSIEALVVAGGGAGTFDSGGAGGAGGLVYHSSLSVTSGVGISYTIGSGGTYSASTTPTTAANGTNSTFGAITAIGGGAGGFNNAAQPNGSSGGSGGGGSSNNNDGIGGNSTQGNSGGGTGYGNSGGDGATTGASGGAGGGAGGTGASGTTSNTQPQGGVGRQYFSNWYAAGGGGSISGSGTQASPASGVGGVGAVYTGNAAVAPVANTGSGGGASNQNGGVGTAGAAGVIVLRYIG